MTSPLLRAVTVFVVAAIGGSASAQVPIPSDIGRGLGPSRAQVAGVIAGVAGATSLVLYLTLHKPSISGCIQSANRRTSLTDEKDNRTYSLIPGRTDLKVGERVRLKGKKIKEKDGSFKFRVKKVHRDYGSCH